MRFLVPVAALALAACGQSAEERRAADDADVAAVKAVQNRLPPLAPIKPEVLMDEDISRIDASGPGCMLRIGEGLAPAVLVTVGSYGWIKLDGEVIKLAGDSGSERGPADTWTRYAGKKATLRIDSADGDIPATEAPGRSRAVTLTLRDAYDRVIYRGEGTQTCSD